MIKRRVIRSRKENGDITALGNPFEYWNPKIKKDVIDEIETGLYNYFVELENNTEIEIKVVIDKNGKYLSTDPDITTQNILLTLPDC
ncbi:MAG: DUF3892 domain-containing protein [Ignavibacteriae bacterium]|nr:DUF3892 domain-containing protein [Ignavibacteriota bacterium]